MKEDASGRRQRAVMATDAEWERIGRAAAESGMDLSRFVIHRALDWDPLPAEVLRRAVREMLVLAKGHTTSWIGYKLHVDTADGGIPVSCIMTSASTHDSQVAVPLGTLTAGRVENLYDLMDAAYDSIEIRAHCILLGHKPIIDVNPRRSVDMQEALRREKKARRTLGLFFPEERRYVERSGSERVNGRLKDEFGGRHVRVRGYDKVLAHLMFGMTVLTASQLMHLIVPPI